MSRHSDDEQPTTVLQQPTAEQPSVTTGPATRRARIFQRRLPARIGRARTSTLIIGALWVLLFALNSTLPQDPLVTVDLPNGNSVQVRSSQISTAPSTPTATPSATPSPTETTSPSATSTASSSTTTPGSTTSGSSTSSATSTGRQTTAPRSTAQTTTQPAPSTSSAPTSQAPSATAPAPGSAPTS
jgi:hypothetical protein